MGPLAHIAMIVDFSSLKTLGAPIDHVWVTAIQVDGRGSRWAT